MLTNTYLPHVGGVARSVDSFTQALRRRGHRVIVIAPTFPDTPADEPDVIRVPAIQRFNGSDFSVRLPVPSDVWSEMEAFGPQLVHTHHPFLLGDTAMRIAAWYNLPLVFTHHTMYERYTHYVPGDSPQMRRFVIRLATDFANLCDHVIAPSESIRAILKQRGVEPAISAIPTGIDPQRFTQGDGGAARQRYAIPADAFVVGHVGRLAPEKNLAFLARAVARFAATDERAHFLVAGKGASEAEIRQAFDAAGLGDRLHLAGSLSGQALADAYHAMDVFAFASQTETQGMVLAEAMTAGVPVVAVDAPGAREVVRDGVNGRLLASESEPAFAAALAELAAVDAPRGKELASAARTTAEDFSLERCTERLEAVYRDLIASGTEARASRQAGMADAEPADNAWTRTLRLVEREWDLWEGRTEAAWQSLRGGEEPTG